MTTELLGLALLMALVTYPSRAVPLLAPGIERLPAPVLEYLRLVGPSVLATLAAVNLAIVTDEAGQTSFHVGIEWLAVGLCVAVMAWRRNLFLGLVVAVGVVAIARWVQASTG
ncbi:MAG: AzlD domain-containing protein [Chloroflexota bacterium]